MKDLKNSYCIKCIIVFFPRGEMKFLRNNVGANDFIDILFDFLAQIEF